jgi:hypothetical protein
MVSWVHDTAIKWLMIGPAAGALVGGCAGAIRPAGYRWTCFFTTWIGASVGTFIGEIIVGNYIDEGGSDTDLYLPWVVACLTGAILGFVFGALTGIVSGNLPKKQIASVHSLPPDAIA